MAPSAEPAIEKSEPDSEIEQSDSVSYPTTLNAEMGQKGAIEETPSENEEKLSRNEIFMLVFSINAWLF